MTASRRLPAWGLVLTIGATALHAFGGDTSKAPPPKIKPELSCAISVSKNADGSKPIGSGGVLTYTDVKAKFYVRIATTNSGSAKAVDYTVHGALFHGNDDLFGSFNKQETDLAAGKSKDFEAIAFPLGDHSDKFKILAELDKANTVDELNETNNSCQIEFATTLTKLRAAPAK